MSSASICSARRASSATTTPCGGRRRSAWSARRDLPARCSSGRGPTRSRAVRPRSSATSWGSGSSGCPATSGSTRRCPGRRSPGVEGLDFRSIPHNRRPDRPDPSPVTDAREFLGMEPVGDPLHWRLRVGPELTTPGNFLFGGCGLGAALVALEAGSRVPDGVGDRAVPVRTPPPVRSSISPSPWPRSAGGSPRAVRSATSATPRS